MAFSDRQVLNFQRNFSWCESNDFEIEEYQETAFLDYWRSQLERTIKERQETGIVIGVDISSMSSPMFAQIILGINEASAHTKIKVRFLYYPGEFCDDSLWDGPVTVCEPVISQLVRWDLQRRLPNVIVGGGFEMSQVYGILQRLEFTQVDIFVPTSPGPRYDQTIERLMNR